MAIVVGNLPLLPDLSSSRKPIADRKSSTMPIFHTKEAVTALICKREFDSKYRRSRSLVLVRGKAGSKVNKIDGENGNFFEEDEDYVDPETKSKWDEEMRKMVQELEEMKELEKKAEELQSRLDQESPADETDEDKRLRVRKELEKVAREQAERRSTAQLMFEIGQKAYGKGMYRRSIEFLEAALTIIPQSTALGGEVQIWLAMAYDANNRHKDCIDLYRKLETTHPSFSIRRQAADLRYILQAPKIKLTEEEKVYFPLIGSSWDSYASSWSDKYKDKDEKRSYTTTNQLPSNKDYLGDFMKWKPPIGWEKNQSFWVILGLWVAVVGLALYLR